MFAIYTDSRVGSGSYNTIQSGLVTAWNEKFAKNQIYTAKILTEEEVISNKG